MFIRTKCDWKQTYFSLVESYRNNEGSPRQLSVHLGKTLDMSAEQWAEVLLKLDDNGIFGVTDRVITAVRTYATKHGLPLRFADAVRDGALLNRQGTKERHERMREKVAKQRGYATVALLDEAEAAQKAADDAEWKAYVERLQRCFRPMPMNRKSAAKLLGVSGLLTAEAVKKAYRTKAQTLHPDHGGDAAQFRKIVDARDILLKDLGTTGSRSVSVVAR